MKIYKIISIIFTVFILLISISNLIQDSKLLIHINKVGVPLDGYIIEEIEENSVASNVGLEVGDKVVQINNSSPALFLLGGTLPEELHLTIIRANENKTVILRLKPQEKLGIVASQARTSNLFSALEQNEYRYLLFSLFKYLILFILALINIFLIFKNNRLWKKISMVLILLTLFSLVLELFV